ncbi:MAG: flagellar hook-basal body complex protein [Alphaproteobacteria bacterium]|nr:MAG: flagellar hook-basal body complex protein [Alphaproteobacteria bacterium]
MDNPAYVALTRQSGLARALQVVANNIANISTTGYRREGAIFAEMLVAQPDKPGTLAMTALRARHTDLTPGGVRNTGGRLDFALEGPGFFRIETAQGERLTRRGSFMLSPDSELVTPEGDRVLDEGGAPIFIPPDAAVISVAADGTIDADGTPVGRLGLVELARPADLSRESGVLFVPEGEILPAETTRVIQGAVEGSNVDPVLEMARMIEIQRAYELGARFLDREDERIRAVIRTLGRAG